MTEQEALKFAKDLKKAAKENNPYAAWELIEKRTNEEVRNFFEMLLNTYIDVHTPKPEQNFVKNWQDSHGDKKILDFGPTEDEDFQDDEGDSPIIININIDKLIW